MSAGFGFSVGDLVLGLKLIKQSIDALQDTKGSSADYQALTHEIDSLKDALEAVEDLQLEQRLGLKSKPCLAIYDAVARCWHCIESFLATISKYQPWLRNDPASGSAWKANLKKIQWALCEKNDVNRFRARLERHSSSISMLLVTLQVSHSFEQSARQNHQIQIAVDCQSKTLDLQKTFDQTATIMLGLNLEQRQLFQSLIESNRQLVQANERTTNELQRMRQVVQVQPDIPPQVALQKPVTLLDACGRVSAFHLDFIDCSEAFLAVLKIRFRQYGVEEQGIKMLDHSQFVLEDHNGVLDLSKPWSRVLRPSQKIDMSMVFRRDVAPSMCPVCGQVNNESLVSKIECLQCGLCYQRVEEPSTDLRPKETQIWATGSGNDPNYSDHARERISDDACNDLIDQFRRIQLVYQRPLLHPYVCFREGCIMSFRTEREMQRHWRSDHWPSQWPHWPPASENDLNIATVGLEDRAAVANLSFAPLPGFSEAKAIKRGSVGDTSDISTLLKRLDENASHEGTEHSEQSEPSHEVHLERLEIPEINLAQDPPILSSTPAEGAEYPDDYVDSAPPLAFNALNRDQSRRSNLRRHLTETVVPGLSRPTTFRRQVDEARDRLKPTKPTGIAYRKTSAQDTESKQSVKPRLLESLSARNANANGQRRKQPVRPPSNSPFHLFDMSAALLDRVERVTQEPHDTNQERH